MILLTYIAEYFLQQSTGINPRGPRQP